MSRATSSPQQSKGDAGCPVHWNSLFAMAKGWALQPGPGRAEFFSFRSDDRLADSLGLFALANSWLTVWSIVSAGFAKGGRAVGLGYSLGRIAVNGSVDHFCRFHERRSHPPSHGQQLLSLPLPQSVGQPT